MLGLLARRRSFDDTGFEEATFDPALPAGGADSFAFGEDSTPGHEIGRRLAQGGVRASVAVAIAPFVVRAVAADGDERVRVFHLHLQDRHQVGGSRFAVGLGGFLEQVLRFAHEALGLFAVAAVPFGKGRGELVEGGGDRCRRVHGGLHRG